MIDKFGNIFYLIIYLVHFIIVGSYAFQLVFGTQKFLEGRGVDKTATLLTRFAGSFMIAMVLMAIYIAFVRSGGLDATWAFFNLVFIINVTILCANFYTLKIDKTGLTEKTIGAMIPDKSGMLFKVNVHNEAGMKEFVTGNNPTAKAIYAECVESAQLFELSKINL